MNRLLEVELNEILTEICVEMPVDLCAQWQLVSREWRDVLEPIVAPERRYMMEAKVLHEHQLMVENLRRDAGRVLELLAEGGEGDPDEENDIFHDSGLDMNMRRKALMACNTVFTILDMESKMSSRESEMSSMESEMSSKKKRKASELSLELEVELEKRKTVVKARAEGVQRKYFLHLRDKLAWRQSISFGMPSRAGIVQYF